jgi:hypothetical protein
VWVGRADIIVYLNSGRVGLKLKETF